MSDQNTTFPPFPFQPSATGTGPLPQMPIEPAAEPPKPARKPRGKNKPKKAAKAAAKKKPGRKRGPRRVTAAPVTPQMFGAIPEPVEPPAPAPARKPRKAFARKAPRAVKIDIGIALTALADMKPDDAEALKQAVTLLQGVSKASRLRVVEALRRIFE